LSSTSRASKSKHSLATRRTPATTSRSRFARPPPSRRPDLNILFVADVFGVPGRRVVEERLPALRDEYAIDFCVVNGENAADGAGITPRLADRLLAAGADAITLGNHVWRRPEIGPYLAESDRVIRPANVATGSPGRALAILPASDGTPVAVVNLLGQLFVNTPVGPFEVVDDLVEEARRSAQVVLVDLHAEATSEKVALTRWLDGRVTAVIGTHTHIQTNDARVLPGGTAAITDAGMTGPHDSVIGVEADLAIRRMRTGMPVRFRPAEGDVRLEGVLVKCDAEGRATSCGPVRVSE
jgi:metallophosphoesterase (TIGR00282 family)